VKSPSKWHSAANHGVLRGAGIGLEWSNSKARQQFFPSVGGVTFFTTLLEGAFVRIDMAVDKAWNFIPCSVQAAGHRPAYGTSALDLDVKTRQWIAGLE